MLAPREVAIDDSAGGCRTQRGHDQEQVHVGGDEPGSPGRIRAGKNRTALVHRFDDAFARSERAHGHPVAHHHRTEAAGTLAEANRSGFVADLVPVSPAGRYEAGFGHPPGIGTAGGLECAAAEADGSGMAQDPSNLIWIDLEMTGLRPDRHHIIEVATVVTDSSLEVLAHGPDLVIRQPEEVLAGMDDWNVQHHSRSGLLDEVRESRCTLADAERRTIEFVRQWVPADSSPICGNSICQDRRFLYQYMPRLERWFHYRNLDVSTVKILAQRWTPGVAEGFKKANTHRAPDDILESIRELRHFREHLFV